MSDPATFRAQLDTIFSTDHNSVRVPLRLVEVTDERTAGGFRQFSVFFHGPADQVLQQGSYPFEHDTLGRLDLFIVPVVGSNPERIIYETCFTGPMLY